MQGVEAECFRTNYAKAWFTDERVFETSFCSVNKAGVAPISVINLYTQLYFKGLNGFRKMPNLNVLSFIFEHFVRYLDIVVEYKVEGKEAVKKTYVMDG